MVAMFYHYDFGDCIIYIRVWMWLVGWS